MALKRRQFTREFKLQVVRDCYAMFGLRPLARVVLLLEITLKGLRHHVIQGRALLLREEHGTAVEVGASAHVEGPGEWLIWLSPFLLAEDEIIVDRLFKRSAQGLNILPLVADEAADILDFTKQYTVLVAVVDRTGIPFIGHRILHMRPSRSSVSMIWYLVALQGACGMRLMEADHTPVWVDETAA